MVAPKDPWSDEQLQSTPAGPPDTRPWKVTLAAILALAVLVLAGYFLWDRHAETEPAPPAAATDR